MISVYVNHYNPVSGETRLGNGNTETRLFGVPAVEGDFRPFIDATVKEDMGKAGNFEFTVDPESVYYNIWIHMRTLVRVEYDGDTIFYGRVLTIDRDMFRSRKIHCEGAFTFFMDSVFEGKKDGYETTLLDYLTMLINAHNHCMTSAPEKMIQLGEVPGQYSSGITADQQIQNDRQKFDKQEGYKTVKELLEEVNKDYGGFMRIRYASGTMYLDWLKLYFNSEENRQTMSVSSNVVDLSDTVEVNNIFTHVLPIGKNNRYISNSGAHPAEAPTSGENHSVTVVSNAGGTAQASASSAVKGVKIKLTPIPKVKYWFKQWNVVSGGITIVNNEFVMPDNNVVIEAIFQDKDGGIPIEE